MALPGSRAEQLARELSGRKSLPTARELGRQYRENVMAQQLLTVKEEKALRSAQEMARQTGAQVVIDRSLRKDANGYYQNGVIHLSEDMEKAAITVFKHELTHHLQQTAPEEYQAFRAAAVELAGEQSVQQLQEQYARHGVQLTDEEALDEVAADFTEQLLTDSESIKQLIDTKPTLADRFFAALRELLQRLTGRVDPKLKKAEQLWTEAYKAAQGNKNTAREGGEKQQFLFKGKDPVTGRSIYESNFPKGTPKAAKSKRILDLVQNVWSKKPITMYVEDEVTGMSRMIEARFDPTYSEEEGVETDARKLAGGNNLGNAKERRVTLDLADDYYRIAQEANYDHSLPEEGKLIATHKGVKTWHYFADNILFQEYGETETTPYRVVINIKEKNDGEFVYSFSAFEQKNKGQAPSSLNTGVTTALSGSSNAQPSNVNIAQGSTGSKKKFSMKEDGGALKHLREERGDVRRQ